MNIMRVLSVLITINQFMINFNSIVKQSKIFGEIMRGFWRKVKFKFRMVDIHISNFFHKYFNFSKTPYIPITKDHLPVW